VPLSYQPLFASTHEEWADAGWYESLFCAPPPASPARDTNPGNRRKSRRLPGLVLSAIFLVLFFKKTAALLL
jgi:hypothetical protein